ncbi:unnamed protein product [Tilletia controversa]|uniref:NmrA-like domain-containing protein n=2 Tax=Tilletia TaxID=13289 RepID=A0A177VDT2_9BASI|nr:hypothetical protein CF336_g762 [Tilletia laevis]KAE8264966.1 hypothetical protein A4X03_0g580 [Tilletia caries]CAD6929922.1 unnamed protein product [Tilletia controversa]KAE8208370.1 hypothetical protein CF335_g466 [Tilletia laevis]CAD6887443.1 unnamed protein product [Tilletia caries]
MSGLKTFAVLGSGAIGKPLIEEFLAAKLPLTILTRDESKPDLQPYKAQGATLKAVDYDSIDSIAAALEGVDAFISALGNQHKEGLPNDLAKAAKKAGVKVYVPSEFGLDYANPRTAPFPGVIQGKIDHQKFVEQLGLPWVAFTNGAFGDWLFHPAFGYDFKSHTAVLRSDGNVPLTVTDTRDVGLFVLLALTTQPIPQPGQGKVYRVEGYATTQNEANAALEKASGVKWEVKKASYEEAAAKQTENSFDGFVAWLNATLADGRQKLDTVDNELVGFKPRYFLDDHAKIAVANNAS